MTLAELAEQIHKNAIRKGFWTWEGAQIPLPLDVDYRSHFGIVIEKLCLIHSEVSEALEALRDGDKDLETVWHSKEKKPEGFAVELADILIRVLDLSYAVGIKDFERIVLAKMLYNECRPYLHGKKV